MNSIFTVKTNSKFQRIEYLHIPPAHDKFPERHYSAIELFLVLFPQSQIHHGHRTLIRKKKVTLQTYESRLKTTLPSKN